jgi:oligosaccharyltransferase complex subunit beta
MRWSIVSVLLGVFSLASALSSSGNRLLVVLEDSSKKALYSTFWSDLEGLY